MFVSRFQSEQKLHEMPAQGEVSRLILGTPGIQLREVEKLLTEQKSAQTGRVTPLPSVNLIEGKYYDEAAHLPTGLERRFYWLRGAQMREWQINDLVAQFHLDEAQLRAAVAADVKSWHAALEERILNADNADLFFNALALRCGLTHSRDLARAIAAKYSNGSNHFVENCVYDMRRGIMPELYMQAVWEACKLPPENPYSAVAARLLSPPAVETEAEGAAAPGEGNGPVTPGKATKKPVSAITRAQQLLAEDASQRFVSLAGYALNKMNMSADEAYNPPPAQVANLGIGLRYMAASSRVGTVGGSALRTARWANEAELECLLAAIERHAQKEAESRGGRPGVYWYNQPQRVMVGKKIETLSNLLEALKKAHAEALPLRAVANMENTQEPKVSIGK